MKKLTDMKINELRSHAAKLQRALDIRKNLGNEHDRILKELKAERERGRLLAAKCDSLLTNSKGQYQPEMEELKRFINEELEAEYCSQTSHAMSDAKNIIRRQQKELSSLASKIADLESRLADVSKAETSGGPFYFSPYNKSHSYTRFQLKSYGWTDGQIDTLVVDTEKGEAPSCPGCTAKQERIDELEAQNELYLQVEKRDTEMRGRQQHTIGELSEQIEGLKSDVQAAECHADQLTNICTNTADLISSNSDIAISDVYTMVDRLIKDRESRIDNQSTTIESYAADRVEMQNRIALDKSSILRLTRELSAALLGGE